ncbi:DMT family transporter [Cryobacterium psychrophilum]|uniref:DMT family transporter n=1 Tax=Cryobacterium psychrophilum TaxID=41988 RepID=A0A4Y8KMP5_9MICO|nr:DMT family transporter [Cryobacterium psychrophilum]TDW30313.1 drug/metabolite transporter (DMT)-like permease [Cryobacterium psychrophilum]TFD77527.1 DMT family transporter [Cryobacterium psychrophilum]
MKATIALVLATLMWAGNYVVGSIAVQTMAPVELTWIRWLLACVPLLALAHVVEKPNWRKVLRHWPRLLLLAGLGVGGYNMLLYTALQYTTPQSASLINAANPAVMVVLAALLLRERIGWRGIAGLILGLCGVVLIITNGALASVFTRSTNAGDLLMVGAVVVWSLYTIVGRGLPVPPITATAVQGTLVAVLLAPVALLSGASWPADARIGWAVIFIAIFPSIGSYVLWNSALKSIPPGRAGLFLNLITVFTVIIAVILGAQLTAPQLIGGVIVFAGVALSTLRLAPANEPLPRKRERMLR